MNKFKKSKDDFYGRINGGSNKENKIKILLHTHTHEKTLVNTTSTKSDTGSFKRNI